MTKYYMIGLIKLLFNLMIFMVFIRSLMSWFQGSYHRNRFFTFINDATDPLLNLIKKYMPNTGMIDFSPWVAVILLEVVKEIVIYFLSGF